MKQVLALIIGVTCLFGIDVASRQHDKQGQQGQAVSTVTEVKVCPMDGMTVEGEGEGSEVFGKYKVYFCCPGCKESFNLLSLEEKQKRVAAAVEKQKEIKRKG